MTASLPFEVQQVFDRFRTTEFTTVDGRGQPVCWPARPAYEPGGDSIEVAAAAEGLENGPDARANPKVALLFSDPAGSGLESPPQVLVQGIADADLRVRPERVFVWPEGDPTREPTLFDAHMEEVRSGHDEEPDAERAGAEGGPETWDPGLAELGERCVLSLVAPDGFPFSVRVRVTPDDEARRVRIEAGALGVPVQPGLACLNAGEVQVRGDLVEEDGGWALVPHRVEKKSETQT